MTKGQGAAKHIDSQLSKLHEENMCQEKRFDSICEVVQGLKEEVLTLQHLVSVNIEKREASEVDLANALKINAQLEKNQKKMEAEIESQAQYSRKSTLLLSGRAIPQFREGENTRLLAIQLMKEHLDMSVHPCAITACHRLRNRSIIIIRFAIMDECAEAYRRRFSPKNRGLICHEALTPQRHAIIRICQRLHRDRASSPFKSYSTNAGRIFVTLPNGKSIELTIDMTEADILAACARHAGLRDVQLGSRGPAGRNSRPRPAPVQPLAGAAPYTVGAPTSRPPVPAGSGVVEPTPRLGGGGSASVIPVSVQGGPGVAVGARGAGGRASPAAVLAGQSFSASGGVAPAAPTLGSPEASGSETGGRMPSGARARGGLGDGSLPHKLGVAADPGLPASHMIPINDQQASKSLEPLTTESNQPVAQQLGNQTDQNVRTSSRVTRSGSLLDAAHGTSSPLKLLADRKDTKV